MSVFVSFKKTGNPQVEELTKSCKERQFATSNLDYVKREDGTKGCVWCGDPLKSKHHATRYCKDPVCPKSSYAWGYPQKEEGLNFLLIRQNFLCAICGYDYKPLIDSEIMGKYYGTRSKFDYMKELNQYLMKRLKRHTLKVRKPEVDHIIPIYKGGMSLGLDNHQAICYGCHKAKSKVDNSGPRKAKNDTPTTK